MEKWYILDRKYRILYGKLVFLSLLYVLPIILVNMYYNDDLARSLYGAAGWNGDGRPLGETLMLFLCGGIPLADIAPLPLLLSVFLLSYVLVLYVKNNLDSVFDGGILLCILLFIITNPFAMSNLSYRFDSIIMFSALSLAFLVFAMPDSMAKVWLAGSSFLAGIAIMSLYQAAIGMCIALFVISVFYMVLEGRRVAALSGIWKMAGAGAGALFYKLFLVERYVGNADWRYDASRVIGFGPESIKIILSNILDTCGYIKSWFVGITHLNQIALALFCLCSMAGVLYLYLKKKQGKGILRVMGALFLVLSPVLVAVATFLPLMVLAILPARSRVFLSFGVAFFYVGIMLLFFLGKYKRWKRTGIFLTAVCIFFQYTGMYTYGNALKSQDEYQKYLVYQIAHNLETINGEGGLSLVSFAGQPPKARQVQKICSKYPFLNEMIPVYLDNDTWIGGAWLYHYLQYDLTIVNMEEADWQVIASEEAVSCNSIYSCFLNGEKIIVEFH